MNNSTLLIVGDSPTLNSGFAKVVQNLARRWKPHFKRIDFWAINYLGYPGQPGRTDQNEWMRPPFVLYPAAIHPEEPWHSRARMQALINHVLNGDYTHIFVIQDHFLLAQHKFPQVFRAACEATKTASGQPVSPKKSYYYIPVDASIQADWCSAVEAFDFPIPYTHYAAGEIAQHSGNLLKDLSPIPHGVDTSVYFPLGDRDKLREERSGGWIKPGDIVMINVNANQRRKDVIRSLEILLELRRVSSKFKLIMHMRAEMPKSDGVDLHVAAEQLGLTHGLEWQCTDDGTNFLGIVGMLTEEDLNALYNCADIYLTTTLGEGWGLGITEALAAGLSVAAPNHTACKEIADQLDAKGMTGRFIRLPLESGTVCLNMDNSRLRRRVSIQGAANAIVSFVKQESFGARNIGLEPYVKKWLSWDRIAEQWLGLFRAPKPGKRYFIELYGGLGDMFNGLYYRSAGKVLADLGPNETATVVLYCNNPYAAELFENHPKREQIEIIDPKLWDPELSGKWQDLVRSARKSFNLPRRGAFDFLPAQDASHVEFYPMAMDTALMPPKGTPYIVLAPSAGLAERNLPGRLMIAFAERLKALHEKHGVLTCWVGRDYKRHGRNEVKPNEVFDGDAWFLNLIDRLSVPGVACLMQNAAGLITCHSALNPLAWRMRKPQLLLYPDSVYERHIKPKDQWAFGIGDPLVTHCRFEDYNPTKLDQFISMALGPLCK